MIVVTLTVTQGDDQGAAFRILDGETKTIGRSSTADIVLNDPGVSRKHCRMRVTEGTPYLFDLSSRNGTSLNGSTITIERVINNDDVIEIGTSSIGVQVISDAAQTGAPPVEAPAIDPDLESAPSLPDATGQEAFMMGAFDRYLDHNGSGPKKPLDPQESVATAFEAPPAMQPVSAPRDLSGTLIGGCRVEELLSVTPMRQVYRATQLSMERIVALRVLPPQMTNDKAAVERFVQTAREGGRLVHPNIVQVYDAGEDNNIYFIALELVDGQSLQEIIRNGKKRGMDIAEAASIAEQLAEAMEFAHTRSAIHGNITPDNIFVTVHGVAKLAEFGFSGGIAAAGKDSTTGDTEKMLRLCYMAPEQITDMRAASVRSDIYSLGAVLFHMLAGRPPFRGLARREITERILRGKHEKITAYRKEIPESVVRIVNRAMARTPEERYAYASEMKDDIARFRAELKP